MSDASLLIKLGLDTSALVTGVNRSNQILSGFQNQLAGFGRQIAAGLGFSSLAYAVIGAVKEMAEFQKSMSEVKAITGATGKEFEDLRNNALELAGAFRAIDISKLETEFGRLGFSTQEILDATEATINLASATGSDLATSATITGSTLRAFNLDAKETGRVADVMAGALNRSGLDMSNFAEAIKYVAPNAYAANISLEETSALLGILADNGIKGSMAGTTLRRIIQDLSKDGRPLVERLQELGEKGLSASDAMEEVGRIGSTGLLILTKNTDKVEALSESLHHVTGEAKAMSDVMQDNLIGDWNKLVAAVDTMINSNDGLISGLRPIIQYYTELIKLLNGTSAAYDWLKSKQDSLWENVRDKNIIATGGGAPDTSGGFRANMAAAILANSTGSSKTVSSSPGGGGSSSSMIMPYGTNPFGDSLNIIGGLADMATPKIQGLSDAATSMGNALAGIQVKTTPLKGFLDGFHVSVQRMGYAFAQMGSQISSGLAAAINGTVPFAQAMASMAVAVVNSLEQMALAYIIEAATKEGSVMANPFLAIAGATIGFAAIKALFGAIGGGGSSSSAPSGNGASIQQSSTISLQPGTFRIDGRDLVLAYDKNKGYQSYQTTGG